MQALKPKLEKGKLPTVTGRPRLGYLNSLYCPVCGKHLTSFYDGDNLPNREDRFYISEEWNYCSKCGQKIDFSEYRRGKE
jgi:C4-type Zn-finger protein